MERYFLEPYRFIAPFRSTFWVRLSRGIIRRHLRKRQGIVRFSCTGREHLRASLDAKAGILLTPNHSRWPDPMVVGTVLSQQFAKYVNSEGLSIDVSNTVNHVVVHVSNLDKFKFLMTKLGVPGTQSVVRKHVG